MRSVDAGGHPLLSPYSERIVLPRALANNLCAQFLVQFKRKHFQIFYTSMSNTEPLRTLSITSVVAALAESGGGPSGP
jgi:hypothetical protein